MGKRKLGVDIDEVIANYMDGFLEFYNKRYGKDVKKTQFDFYDLSHALHMTPGNAHALILEFESLPDFDKIEPAENSLQCLTSLSENYNLHAITSRQEAIRDRTEKFLKRHFGPLDFKLYFSGDMYSCQGKRKAEICKEQGIPFLCEDSSRYALECAETGTRVILFNKPWNASCQHPLVTRVDGWPEALNAIRSLEGRL